MYWTSLCQVDKTEKTLDYNQEYIILINEKEPH